LRQSDASIIEDPHAVVLVGRNDIDRIHAVWPRGSPLLSSLLSSDRGRRAQNPTFG
jgi:hypothetical protein